jgi:hypothetical protein
MFIKYGFNLDFSLWHVYIYFTILNVSISFGNKELDHWCLLGSEVPPHFVVKQWNSHKATHHYTLKNNGINRCAWIILMIVCFKNRRNKYWQHASCCCLSNCGKSISCYYLLLMLYKITFQSLKRYYNMNFKNIASWFQMNYFTVCSSKFIGIILNETQQSI